jgi:ankyrin repeat protein
MNQTLIDLAREGNLSKIQNYYFAKITNIQVLNLNEAFCEACSNGHLSVTQWLLQIKPNINISVTDETAFRNACSNGHLLVTQWLYSIKPEINISANNEYAFHWACSAGHLTVAQWLYSIKPEINISANNEYAFRRACKNNKLNVAQWLCTLRSNYKITIENDKIIDYNVLKPLPLTNNLALVENLSDCPICYQNPIAVQTNCKHNFCKQCAETFYQKSNSCPYCRQQIIEFSLIQV